LIVEQPSPTMPKPALRRSLSIENAASRPFSWLCAVPVVVRFQPS
jgi:hypothetical protein